MLFVRAGVVADVCIVAFIVHLVSVKFRLMSLAAQRFNIQHSGPSGPAERPKDGFNLPLNPYYLLSPG